MASKPKDKASNASAEPFQHTVKVPELLERRIAQCMQLENMRVYNEFTLIALTRRCRQVLIDHGKNPDEPPPPLPPDWGRRKKR